MSRSVEARLMGGALAVGIDADPIITGAKLVVVECPGLDLALRPNEARTLATALLERAAEADLRAPDSWLQDEPQ